MQVSFSEYVTVNILVFTYHTIPSCLSIWYLTWFGLVPWREARRCSRRTQQQKIEQHPIILMPRFCFPSTLNVRAHRPKDWCRNGCCCWNLLWRPCFCRRRRSRPLLLSLWFLFLVVMFVSGRRIILRAFLLPSTSCYSRWLACRGASSFLNYNLFGTFFPFDKIRHFGVAHADYGLCRPSTYV